MRELRVSGGGAQSPSAVQLTADIFGLPSAGHIRTRHPASGRPSTQPSVSVSMDRSSRRSTR